MRVAHLPQRRGINEIDIAADQRLKRQLRPAGHIGAHQFHVIIHLLLFMDAKSKKGQFFQRKNRGNTNI
jgi:hypothetical protein